MEIKGYTLSSVVVNLDYLEISMFNGSRCCQAPPGDGKEDEKGG